MKQAGYSDEIVRNPHKVTQSQYFPQALAQYGLHEELVSCSLVEDIKGKPLDRIDELKLAADILRMTQKAGGNGNTAVQINLGDARGKYA